MSELRYRAWHKKHQKMFRVIGWREDDDDQLVVWCKDERDITFRFADTINGIPGLTVLMQATGLQDKHCRDIYEGDIVKADWHWDTPHVIAVPHDYYDIVEYALEAASLEILGNAYETPELLKSEVTVSEANTVTLIPAKVKNLQIHEWCPDCNKVKSYSCTLLFGETGDDPGAVDAPAMCVCSLFKPQHYASLFSGETLTWGDAS